MGKVLQYTCSFNDTLIFKGSRKNLKKTESTKSDLDLPRKYTRAIVEKASFAKDLYLNNEIIEAFVILHASLEVDLQLLWAMFLRQAQDPENTKRFKRSTRRLWEYSQLVDLLNDVNMINDQKKELFDSFRIGRNNVVHNMMNMEKLPKKKDLDHQFNAGLKAYNVTRTLFLKVFELSKKPRVDLESSDSSIRWYKWMAENAEKEMNI